MQDLPANSQAIIPCGAEVKLFHISAKDQGRVHQFGTKVCPGIFKEYSLNARERCSGDLLMVHTEDLQTMPPSDIHVNKFK